MKQSRTDHFRHMYIYHNKNSIEPKCGTLWVPSNSRNILKEIIWVITLWEMGCLINSDVLNLIYTKSDILIFHVRKIRYEVDTNRLYAFDYICFWRGYLSFQKHLVQLLQDSFSSVVIFQTFNLATSIEIRFFKGRQSN